MIKNVGGVLQFTPCGPTQWDVITFVYVTQEQDSEAFPGSEQVNRLCTRLVQENYAPLAVSLSPSAPGCQPMGIMVWAHTPNPAQWSSPSHFDVNPPLSLE